MRHLKKTIRIHARLPKVFEFLHRPESYPKFWPNMVEVTNAARREDGFSFDWVYKQFGVPLHGHAETLKVIRNELIELRLSGPSPSTFWWQFAKDAEVTAVAVEVDYSVSAPFGGGVTEALMFRPHEQELEAMLANLKARLERNGNGRAKPVG